MIMKKSTCCNANPTEQEKGLRKGYAEGIEQAEADHLRTLPELIQAGQRKVIDAIPDGQRCLVNSTPGVHYEDVSLEELKKELREKFNIK